MSRRHHYQWHAPSTPERMLFLASASPEEAADTGEGNGDRKIRRNCSCRGDHLCHDYEVPRLAFGRSSPHSVDSVTLRVVQEKSIANFRLAPR